MATMNVLDAAGGTVAVEKPLAPGRAAAAASRPVALSNEDAAFLDGLETKLDSLITQGASTADVGVEVHHPGDIITITPTLDTSIYASGDVLFTTTAIPNAVRVNDAIAQLQSLVIVDKDDQKPEIALKFWSSNVTYGAFNGAPSISDSDAASCLGRVNIVTADYDDDGGVSTAFKDNIGKILKAASGTRTIYITGKLTSGTPTHTASGIVIRLALLWA
jgi:hypothetical protein